MCGRVALFTPPARLARFLDATLAAGLDPEGRASWNVGPQRQLVGITEHEGRRVMEGYQWGLIPAWASDPAISNRLINARGETVAEKPSFREAFRRRPCVLPVDGFYEWDVRGSHKQPHYFTRRDGAPALFAGLYELWRDPTLPPDAPPRQTCTVLTTEPSDDIEGVHDRMPIVLDPSDVSGWLRTDSGGVEERLSLIRPAPVGTLQHLAVNPAVGSIRNDGPEMIEPVVVIADRLF
jgi:putative SOS response-associated peptidase YedK